MSQFIVSARKYRPTTFNSVVGQEQVTQTLSNAIAANKIAQAYLFCGPRGVGKTTCARIFAREINKGAVPEGSDLSFNIFELDAASNNSVEDIRTITDQVRIPPQVGKYKVYIIDEVHMLSQQAFNAFLKTLEEPPPYAIFILATTEKHKILPTILSRCQIYDFKRISVKDIIPHLATICEQENITYEEEALPIIAQKADGALRDALSIFDRLVSFNQELTYQSVLDSLNILDYEYYFKVTDAILQQDAAQLMLYFEEILSLGFEGDTFINGLSQHFRDLMMCQNTETVHLLEVGEQMQQRYQEQANYTPLATLLNGLNLFNTCEVQYKTAQNKRLHVELTLLKVCYLPQAQDGGPLPTAPSSKKKTSEVTPPPKSESSPKKEPKNTPESPPTSTEVETVPPPEAPASPPTPPPAAEQPPKKTRKSRLFGDIAQPPAEKEQEEKAESNTFQGERPQLSREHLDKAQAILSATFTEENEKSLHAILKNYEPQIEAYTIRWVVGNKLEWALFNDNRHRIMDALAGSLPDGFEIEVTYDVAARDQIRGERPLTVKERYQKAMEKNPNLKSLQERLDLDLEY